MDLTEGIHRATEDVSLDGAAFAGEVNSRRINNVALCGMVSKNGYRYKEEAMRAAVGKYRSVQAFVSHPTVEELKTGRRDVRKLAGKVENPRFEGNKIRGDIVTLPDAEGEKFFNTAKIMPESVGLSHVADIKLIKEGEELVVEEIRDIFSVDLVASPATNRNMFESTEDNGNSFKDDKMDYAKASIAELKTARPDIADALVQEGKDSRDEDFNKLESENKDVKAKLDELNVKAALEAKTAQVEKIIAESKLPKEAKTDIFREQLMAIESEGDEFAKACRRLVEDRMSLLGGVKNMGSGGGGRKDTTKPDANDAYEIMRTH
jgi:hypothetical protein